MELQSARTINLPNCRVVDGHWLCPMKNCNVLTSNYKDLHEHFIHLHRQRPYPCDYENCAWTFASKSKLERHKQCTHSPDKSFHCDYEGCEKTFKSNSNLKHHKKQVHESKPKFLCPIGDCCAAFHHQKSLDYHLPVHEDAKPGYRCEVPRCGKAFFTRNSLCSHMRRHEYKEDDLKCKLCGKEFEAPCRLRSHMQGHENNRPYPCPQEGCQWSFPSQSKLSRHMDKHLQNRRYRCSTDGCTKAFLRLEHLNDHIKTHFNVKIYRCPVKMCDAVFDARKLVQPHVTQMHPKQSKTVESPTTKSSQSLSETPDKLCDDSFEMDQDTTSTSNVSPVRQRFEGSARTSLTYCDLVQLRHRREDMLPETLRSDKVLDADCTEKQNLVDVAGQCEIPEPTSDNPLVHGLDSSDLETRELLQTDSSPTVQQDLMLSGANLNDSSSLILQEELLTQEYFLFLESSNRLSDFEPSTINLRDLE